LPLADDVDGFGEVLVAWRLRALEVIESSENVVVPPREEDEAFEVGLDDVASPIGAKEAMNGDAGLPPAAPAIVDATVSPESLV